VFFSGIYHCQRRILPHFDLSIWLSRLTAVLLPGLVLTGFQVTVGVAGVTIITTLLVLLFNMPEYGGVKEQ
jgi:hypothetical protein